jgi:heavy metal sensor kinase
MRSRSIRFRLTAWYTAVLTLALLLFGVFSWVAVREVLMHAVDEELEDRVAGVRKFMDNQIASLSVEEIRDEFKEHSVLGPGGDLFQVCDAQGVWLYRSASLEEADVPIERPAALTKPGLSESRLVKDVSVRFLSRPVTVLGKLYTVQVAALTGEIEEGLARFRWTLVLLIPAVLAIATGGGWWMSRRALAPVDEITATARSIGESSLSRRLPVPGTNDELERLSLTLNQMLERIEGAFRRVTEFTADASHELRTPIALVRTTAELALRRQRTEGDYRGALEEILNEAERTTGLIENLLTLARADAGKAQIERSPVDAASLLLEAAEQARKLAAQKEISFDHSPFDPGPLILGDAGALRRLLLIVLDNAVKYTPSGGSVALVARTEGQRLHVEVRDTGIGIAVDDLPHIFERFYRADKSRSRDSGGAGLGLSLAKWIADAHGGEIFVESSIGRGSVFRLVFSLETTS